MEGRDSTGGELKYQVVYRSRSRDGMTLLDIVKELEEKVKFPSILFGD
jgi:hypothetical protein